MGEKACGTVYLVGAGPGDPDLITWRGMQLLGRADAVCIDALVDPTLIAALPARVERYYVGKHAGHHSLPQDKIEALLIRLAREGKEVVRLKGGDPFVFGRGGEEALALAAAGVPFEVVPGVTAAVAASAYAGIPITQRGLATFALLLTAHETPDKDSSGATLPWPELAALSGGTLAGYMGVRQLPNVVERLLAGGMSPTTPAALVERGTTGGQRVVTATLQDLAESGERAGIKPPALFVIGDVVRLAEKISWFTPGPLAGKRILVTRPTEQAGPLLDALRRQGASMIPAPSIRVEGRFVEAAWKRMLTHDPAAGWLVFTSENGVRYFMEGLRRAGQDIRWLGSFKIAGIGSGTRDELARFGLSADFIPTKATTTALAEELPPMIGKGEWVIRVRGNLGDTKVEMALADGGAELQGQYVYETTTAPLDDLMRAWVAEGSPEIITFTSGSTFTSFLEQWGEEAEGLLRGARLASIGPFTSGVIREAGYEVAIEADPHDVDGLVAAIVADAQNG